MPRPVYLLYSNANIANFVYYGKTRIMNLLHYVIVKPCGIQCFLKINALSELPSDALIFQETQWVRLGVCHLWSNLWCGGCLPPMDAGGGGGSATLVPPMVWDLPPIGGGLPVHGTMRDICENITFPQVRLWTVKISKFENGHYFDSQACIW